MKTRNDRGNAALSAFFFLIFALSVSLNVILLGGCDNAVGRFVKDSVSSVLPQGEGSGDAEDETSTAAIASAANLDYLSQIAERLGIAVLASDTPGDVFFKIRQRIDDSESSGVKAVLSDESFADVKAAILSSADAETFAAYHELAKKTAGKKIIVLEDGR